MNSHLIFITQGTLWLWWRSQCSNSLQAGRSGDRIPRGGEIEIFCACPDHCWGAPSLLYIPEGKVAEVWH